MHCAIGEPNYITNTKAGKMKTFLFIIMMAAIAACKKEDVRIECGQVYDIKETWTDSAQATRQLLSVDTIWQSGSVICGDEFQHWKNYKHVWLRTCDADGVTKYWEHFFIITK